MDTKQVIVMRTDLKMRKGKMITQGAHASMAFLTAPQTRRKPKLNAVVRLSLYGGRPVLHAPLTIEQREWLETSFTKVCVRVESELELLDIVRRAEEARLTVSLIQDSGRTEFHGVPTYTCCAIGPDESEKIDKVTGELELL